MKHPTHKNLASNYDDQETDTEDTIPSSIHEMIAAKRYQTQVLQGNSSVSTAAVSNQIASISMLPGIKLSSSIPRQDPGTGL